MISGETAVDKCGAIATINSLCYSPTVDTDITLINRYYEKNIRVSMQILLVKTQGHRMKQVFIYVWKPVLYGIQSYYAMLITSISMEKISCGYGRYIGNRGSLPVELFT